MIDVIDFVALNGYKANVVRCIWLSRVFYEDRGLNRAVVAGRFANAALAGAAFRGRAERARQLLAHGADVNACDRWGCTVAQVSYTWRHEAVARVLLQQPSLHPLQRLQLSAWLGMTEAAVAALHDNPGISDTAVLESMLAAGRGGHRDTAAAILAARPGMDVNDGQLEEGAHTLLTGAVEHGDADFVAFVLSLPGIDVNAGSYPPLHRACKFERRSLLQLLLASPGIDVNARNHLCNTPLIHCAVCGHTYAITRLLVVPGIDVNAADREGRTALMEAATHGQPGAVATLLRAPGIDIAAVNHEGRTAYQLVREKVRMHEHSECVELILAAEEAAAAAAAAAAREA